MIQDPGGLLGRIPELEPLCQDPGVRRAVEKGEPFAVYRALWWARLTGRLRDQREALGLLLRSRRAFARPLQGKLFLGTFNGFGATLLGSSEADPDGSSVATHWIVALFALPLFPLGAYVVSGGDRKGLSTSWIVYARVPLGVGAWAWSRGVALAVALTVAWAGWAATWAARHHDVTVVNGLTAPLTVRVGGTTAQVAGHQHATINLPVGTAHGAASLADGAVVDELDLDVRSGNERLIWNVAGAAPIFVETVLYRKKPDPGAKEPEPELHCGDRWVVAGRVDDFLQEPPRQVSMREGENVVVRRHLGVARDEKLEEALLCTYLLGDRGRLGDALRVAEARAVAAGWAADEANLAISMAFLAGRAEFERLARAYRAARPGDLAAARDYQAALEAAGQRDAAIAEFARAAAAAPGDAKAQYLHARLLEGPPARAATEAALARFPADPDLLRLAVALRAEEGDWKATVEGWRTLRAAAPGEAGRVVWEAATAYLALGRAGEARDEAGTVAKALTGRWRLEAATVHVLASAPLYGGSPGEALLAAWEKGMGGPQPHLRVRVGRPPAGPLEASDAVHAALFTDPARALELAAALPAPQVAQLELDAWALAWLEAERSGSKAAGVLEAHHFGGLRPRPELKAWVRGEPVALPTGLPLQVRAAAELVRSRVPGLPAPERRALLAAARADDRLGGLVTRASRAWPPAAR